MSHVYILKSLDGRFYIGSTEDIDKRIRHHNSGGTPTTKRFGEVSLVLSQYYEDIKDARSVERKLKRLKRKDYIEKMIDDGFIKIKP